MPRSLDRCKCKPAYSTGFLYVSLIDGANGHNWVCVTPTIKLKVVVVHRFLPIGVACTRRRYPDPCSSIRVRAVRGALRAG